MLSSEADLFAKDTWNGNEQSCNEESSHDGECKYPLECEGFDEELVDTEGSSEDAQCEAHSIVLVDNKEEPSINQDTPDCNIRQNTGR